MMNRSLLLITIVVLLLLEVHLGHSEDFNYRNFFGKVLKTSQDENLLTQFEQRFPKFLEFNVSSNENVDKIFSKFKEAIRLIPPNIQRETALDENSARDIFPSIQPIYRYIKESVWKSILALIDWPKELLRIPAQNLAENNLNNLLSYSDDDTVARVLEVNSNRRDFNDEQKLILVQNYIDRIKSKLNPNNFQQLITQKLGASFLRYLPLNFFLKDPIFNDNNVIRNVANWLHLLSPLQRDAVSNKVYRSLTDTTGKIGQNNNNPIRLTADDPSTLDMVTRAMPSLSTRQIINAIGDKIVPLLERSSIRDDQSCTSALALLNRTIESKRTSNRHFRPDPLLVQRWQECYSGCDLSNLFNNRHDLKELLRNHPNPESCENLIDEVKKEFELERDITANKLREVSDAFGSIYRADEINYLSDELIAELGRDERALEKIGSQDLPLNEARTIMNKIPRSTQNLWGKNMLGKLGNLIPGIDNTILKQILTRVRGDLPTLFNNTSSSFIQKLVPSKIRLLIDQYANEPNLAKYRQLLASDYAKKYIKSETLMKLLQLAPDALRLIRFTPAQASAAIANRLGEDKSFDGSLGNLGLISNFLNGLTKTDVGKIKPEESLQAVQQAFGGSRAKNIDNQMQSNTRHAFGNVLRRGLQTSEATEKVDEYIKGLFREDNLVDDLNPQIFTTMTNAELEAINRLNKGEGDRFWTAIGSIREPACCSITDENRFRLADYALKYYESATGEIDNFKLAQLGIFLTTSLRASDIRRINTDALINKINFFKSNCFQPAKAEAQALGARLNDALGEIDDGLKGLYLDLIGELAVYLPNDIASPKRVLSQRTNYLSKSFEILQTRSERCSIPDTDGFLSKAIHGIKSTLVNAYLDQHFSSINARDRRQTNQGNITCRDIRHMGSALSALSAEQISTIGNDVIFECIGAFGAVNDYSRERVQQIAQKYIQALQDQGRTIASLRHSELYELNSILTGFTPSELFLLRNEHFHDGNFLSFIGYLPGWTVEQLKYLAQVALGADQRLTPAFLENAGQILCVIDEQRLRNILPEEFKSYLSILANIECPIESNVNYSSIMFDIAKKIYSSDLLRPHVFGSLGTIAAGLRSTDVRSIPPELINFFPSQAFARLPRDVFQSFSNEQFENLNVEQMKMIPDNLFKSFNKKQITIINQIRYPFKSTDELIDINQKFHNNHAGWNESGAKMKETCSMFVIWIVPLISMIFMR